jgi:hypothetical protein
MSVLTTVAVLAIVAVLWYIGWPLVRELSNARKARRSS